MFTSTLRLVVLGAVIIVAGVLTACAPALQDGLPESAPNPQEFNGASALSDVEYQMQLGPRTAGSQAHRQTGDWIMQQLRIAGWQVAAQETIFDNGAGVKRPVRNIIAKWGEGRPWLVLGAHYDSRLEADHDPDETLRKTPVPGANDGASGVAALMELGRVLPSHAAELRYRQVWLVFFDAEDNGNLPGWDWILGSQAFVASLTDKPDAAVIVDMIGDKKLKIFIEKNSDQALAQEIWGAAERLGYGKYMPNQAKYQILDDHLPFLQAGIPAVDIIDFDYPPWHTTADTLDKVSANSLEVVGKTLLSWMTAPLP